MKKYNVKRLVTLEAVREHNPCIDGLTDAIDRALRQGSYSFNEPLPIIDFINRGLVEQDWLDWLLDKGFLESNKEKELNVNHVYLAYPKPTSWSGSPLILCNSKSVSDSFYWMVLNSTRDNSYITKRFASVREALQYRQDKYLIYTGSNFENALTAVEMGQEMDIV